MTQPLASSPNRCAPLARYVDPGGGARELVAHAAAGGSVLVIDRDATGVGETRLIAHLGSDEPPENAELVCRSYLAAAGSGGYRCRAVTAADHTLVPFTDEPPPDRDAPSSAAQMRARGFSLAPVETGMSIPELRWRRTGDSPPVSAQAVSLREVIACVESYEPARSLTARTLALHATCAEVSTTVLRSELARVNRSSIVLNRGLREAVLAAVEREALSMSEIAIRCGRVKRDRRGNVCGETSWLARRLGLLAEPGHGAPTPWIHCDVLALIAREGLGVDPHEVELG
jgi:hypothetical protein